MLEHFDTRSHLQKLAAALKNSTLSPAAQDDLLSLFSGAGRAELEGVAKFLSNNPAWIAKLYEGCMKKRAALKSGKKASWQEILTEEKRQLLLLK